MLTFGVNAIDTGARLGYHPFDPERMLLRIEDGPSEQHTWIVECWPLDLIPPGSVSAVTARIAIWWQTSGDRWQLIRDSSFDGLWREKDGPTSTFLGERRMGLSCDRPQLATLAGLGVDTRAAPVLARG